MNQKQILVVFLLGIAGGFVLSSIFHSTHYYRYHVQLQNGGFMDKVVNLDNVNCINKAFSFENNQTNYIINVFYHDSQQDKLYFYNSKQMDRAYDKIVSTVRPITTILRPE